MVYPSIIEGGRPEGRPVQNYVAPPARGDFNNAIQVNSYAQVYDVTAASIIATNATFHRTPTATLTLRMDNMMNLQQSNYPQNIFVGLIIR